MIKHIKINRNMVYSEDQIRELFNTICSKSPTQALLHHWGIFESDHNNFDIAESLLKKSLVFNTNIFELYRKEPIQHIYNSLGTLYSKMAIKEEKQKNYDKAQEFYIKADQYFTRAKYGDFMNIYAYHAIGHMMLQRAQLSEDINVKKQYISFALKQIDDAKDNFDSDVEDFNAIESLEKEIIAYMSQIDPVENEFVLLSNLKNISNKYPGAEIYYYYSKFLYYRNKYKLCLDVLNEGLLKYPNDEKCLSLKCRILLRYYPYDNQSCYDVLHIWYTFKTDRSIYLQYNYARLSFLIGYYDKSKSAFEELDVITEGNKNRTKLQDMILENSKNKTFHGKISKIESNYIGYIECSDLRGLRYPLFFRPIAYPYSFETDRDVTFNIGFNYRYPLAVNVKPV